jgi:hypothetical protein
LARRKQLKQSGPKTNSMFYQNPVTRSEQSRGRKCLLEGRIIRCMVVK